MTEQVLSLSQFKTDAARLLDQMRDEASTLVLTQNGRARAVVQDFAEYQAREQAMLMLKLMAEAERDLSAGDTIPQTEIFAALRTRLQTQRDAQDD